MLQGLGLLKRLKISWSSASPFGCSTSDCNISMAKMMGNSKKKPWGHAYAIRREVTLKETSSNDRSVCRRSPFLDLMRLFTAL